MNSSSFFEDVIFVSIKKRLSLDSEINFDTEVEMLQNFFES
jgi:hypothetical protein